MKNRYQAQDQREKASYSFTISIIQDYNQILRYAKYSYRDDQPMYLV